MSIITLTTDLGDKDYFIPIIIGKILSNNKNIKIVNISNTISPYNIFEAAYILKNSYKYFPKGTIHIVGVNCIISKKNIPICVLINDHYFLCTDNGIISLINEENDKIKVYKLKTNIYNSNSISPIKDYFCEIACYINNGGELNKISYNNRNYNILKLNKLNPIYRNDKLIIGTIIYIDNFGNLITNISKKFFENKRKHRKYKILLRQENFYISEITKIFEHYNEIEEKEEDFIGHPFCLFNSCGLLEVSLYKSNPKNFGAANNLMGLKENDTIYIEFENK